LSADNGVVGRGREHDGNHLPDPNNEGTVVGGGGMDSATRLVFAKTTKLVGSGFIGLSKIN
jgi:hypothetical protein